MKKKLIYAAIAAVVVIIAGVILVSGFLKQYREKHAPSTTVLPLADYYKVADGEAMIILDEKVYEKTALWRSNTAYLDLDSVLKMYNHRFFWIEAENLLIYTTPSEDFRFTPGEKDYILNFIVKTSEVPMVEKKDEVPYISIDFLKEHCGMTVEVYNDPDRIMITYEPDSFLAAEVIEETQIRVSQNIKADILKTVKPGDIVRFIDGGGIRENGFIKVMSGDGVRGYMLESALEENYYAEPVFAEFKQPEYTHLIYADKVYLGWQLLYSADSLAKLNDAIDRAPEMNVVAPTWFFLVGTEGEMMSYASSEYVDRAHEAGLKVWATYKNDPIEGKFATTEDTHALLSSTSARTALINNMIDTVDEYELDGINIDFENLKVDSGIYFIQFLRELSVRCRAEGIIISVDNYVPENYNAFYNIPEQSKLVDYIIIMGYDQHYAGGNEAGSVSSLDWFTAAAQNTAAQADATRVIMAVPFYTRLWMIKDGGIYVEETPDMAAAEKLVTKAKASKEWKEDAGQHYAEWTSGGAKYKIWLEDEESLRAKTYAARALDMAGIAAWKCGDEIKGTWAAIVDAMEGELPVEEPEDENGVDIPAGNE